MIGQVSVTSIVTFGWRVERAPDLLRHVGLVAFDEQFGEVGRIACGGEDRIQDDLAGGAVVRDG